MVMFNKRMKAAPFTASFKYGLLLLVLAVAGCGGGGGGSSEQKVSVTIAGSVYDGEVGGAIVELLLNDAVIATTISDAQGNYTFSLSTTASQRAKRAVVRANRGDVILNSLLGTLQTVVDARDGASLVRQDNYPGVMVSNVTSAMASVIKEQNGGSLPTDQATIDSLTDTIAGNVTLQDLVLKIAGCIKAVVDHGSDPASLSVDDTEEMADMLSNDVAMINAHFANLLATSTTGWNQSDVLAQVTSDPILAVQLPETVDDTDITGNYYIVGGDNMLYFQDASNVWIHSYDSIRNIRSGTPGTWSYNAGVITIQYNEQSVDHTSTITILGGTVNAISITAATDGMDQGAMVMYRMEPIDAGANLVEADFSGEILVDFADSSAIRLPATCDSLTQTNGWLTTADFSIPAACEIHGGMLIIFPDWSAGQIPDNGAIVIGLLSDAWDGVGPSQASNIVVWQQGSNDTETRYSRGYRTIDVGGNPCFSCPMGTDPNPITLRISTEGVASMRVLKTGYVDANNPAEQVVYKDGNATPRERLVWTEQDIGWSALVNEAALDLPGTSSPRVAVSLGSHTSGDLRAIFTVDNLTNNDPVSVETRTQHRLNEFVSGDVSGKSFDFTDLLDNNSGTLVFNANGTGSITENAGAQNFTWTIGEDTLTSSAFGAMGQTYTTLLLTWPDSSQSVVYRTADLGGTSYIIGVYEKSNTDVLQSVGAAIISLQ